MAVSGPLGNMRKGLSLWLQQNWKGKTITDWLKWKLWGKTRWVLQLGLTLFLTAGHRQHILKRGSSRAAANEGRHLTDWPLTMHAFENQLAGTRTHSVSPKMYVLSSQVLGNGVCSQLSSYLSSPGSMYFTEARYYSWCKLSTYIQILKFSLIKNIFEIIF